MRGWMLTDYFEAHDESDEPYRVAITSADHLRQELERLAALPPRIAELEDIEDRIVRIGIGGPLGGFGLVAGLPGAIHLRLAKSKTPARVRGLDFLYWQQPCRLAADHLFPVADLIELLVAYRATRIFPADIVWDAG